MNKPHALLTVLQSSSAGPVALTAPVGFDDFGALPFTIYENPDGTIAIDSTFNLRTYSDIDNAAGTDYYVDPVSGDDTTGLSWAHAFKAIYWASSAATPRIIYVKSGFYDVDTGGGGWQGLGNAKAIICVDPTPAILCRTRKQTYSASSSHYDSASTTAVIRVYDLSSTNADGSYLTYTLAADEAGVDSTPGTFYWASNVLHVHTFDDRAPDANIKAVIGGSNFDVIVTSDKTIYVENCRFLFGGVEGTMNTLRGNGATLNAYFKDCTWSHGAGGPNAAVLGTCNAIFRGCRSEYSYTDGFNYHVSTTLPKGIEIDCIARYSGYLSGTGATFNGSSTHDGAPAVRINGDYGYSFGVPVGDVGGSQSWNLGCESHHSLTPTAARNVGFLVGNTGPTKMWLHKCHAHDNTYDLAPIEGEAIYTRDCTLSAGQNYDDGGGGTVTPY